MTQIKDALREFNPWWEGKFKVEFKEREILSKMEKFLKLPQIIALTGLRRVGKTTLMLKIGEEFVNKGLEPRRVLYFSFDEFRKTGLREVIQAYEEMMEANVRDGKFLLLLDEVQKLDGWEDQIKGIYDLYGKGMKIIISGSESLFIKRKTNETLAGRIFSFKVGLLTFREFLIFRGTRLEPVGLYERELNRLLEDYIITLGLPELVHVRDKEIIKKYVKEGIIDKVVYRDMQQMFRIKDISKIDSILNMLLEEPGQLWDLSELASELGISRQTLSTYLTYLEESFLVKKLYNYSKNRRKVERKLKKYYPTIISPDLLFRDDSFSKSKVFEWLIVMQLDTDFFWRDTFKNEVDIVMFDKEKAMPVEVKYGKIEHGGLLAFAKKFSVSEGKIVSRSSEEKRKVNGMVVNVVPAVKFLLRKT